MPYQSFHHDTTGKFCRSDGQPEHPNSHTVMLLHGKNFCGAYWGQTVKALAAHGYRVMLDSAGVDKVIVLGHSMGGMVAEFL